MDPVDHIGPNSASAGGTVEPMAASFEPEPEFEPVAVSPLDHVDPLAPDSDGKLIVMILRCTGLAPANKRNNSDAYATLTLNGQNPQKTKVVKKTLNPEFNEHKDLHILRASESHVMQLTFYDWEKVGNHDFLGECQLDLRTVFGPEGWMHTNKSVALPLQDPNLKVRPHHY
jgi:Ca2+-dependent lipid-binding protein